jgi:hypothetical protein
LAPKWDSLVAKGPQQSPHPALGIGLIATQALRSRARARINVGVGHEK